MAELRQLIKSQLRLTDTDFHIQLFYDKFAEFVRVDTTDDLPTEAKIRIALPGKSTKLCHPLYLQL